ncbi:MAG: hypothetical protein ACXWUG_16660 [Polyangiales bacterium]
MGDKDISSNVFDGQVRSGQLNATLEVTGVVSRRVYALAGGGSSELQIPVPPPIDPVTSGTSTADGVARIRAQLTYALGLLDVIK